MSILEFQLNTPAFLAAQRNALRSLHICPSPSPGAILIDKIEFGNNTIRHNVDEEFTVLFDSLTSTLPGRDTDGFQTQIGVPSEFGSQRTLSPDPRLKAKGLTA